MRRFTFLLVVTHLLAAVALCQDSSKSSDPTVYTTKSGSKYHNAGCRYLSKSAVEMKLSQVSERYGACSVCEPPTMRNDKGKVQGTPPSDTPQYKQPSSSGRSQCAATTKKGSRCKRMAQEGSSYCWQHM